MEIQTEIVSTCIYKLVYSQSCPQAFLYTNHNAPYHIIYIPNPNKLKRTSISTLLSVTSHKPDTCPGNCLSVKGWGKIPPWTSCRKSQYGELSVLAVQKIHPDPAIRLASKSQYLDRMRPIEPRSICECLSVDPLSIVRSLHFPRISNGCLNELH